MRHRRLKQTARSMGGFFVPPAPKTGLANSKPAQRRRPLPENIYSRPADAHRAHFIPQAMPTHSRTPKRTGNAIRHLALFPNRKP